MSLLRWRFMLSPSEVAILETVGKSGVANDRAGTL